MPARPSIRLRTLNMKTGQGEAQRFFEAAKSYFGEDCLIWPFSRKPNGYAAVCVKGRRQNVHRAICLFAHGEPPSPKHEAAHSCGNGTLGCITRKHLRWATRQENIDEKASHGRIPRGEHNKKSRLTDLQAIEIRHKYATERLSQRALAKEYKVAQGTISSVLLRKTWTHLLDGVAI